MNSLEDSDKLQCMLCDMRSNSLGRHIVAKHYMTLLEYKAQFPGSKTNRLTSEQIAKMTATKRQQGEGTKHRIVRAEAERRASETLATGVQPLQCSICGKESANSLISHITRSHSVTMNEYRVKFPNCKVQRTSPSQRANNSRVMKEKLSDPIEMEAFLAWRSFPSEIKHWIRKGFDPREAHEKVADFQRLQSLKGNNETTRNKRSVKNTGSNNPMSLSSISLREGVTESEAKKLTPCFGRTGEKHPMFGKKHTDEALKKIGQHINHNGKSKIEHELTNQLIKLYGGEKNAPVNGWCCDYVQRNQMLVVEFFGDFWHHNPNLYAGEFVNRLTKRSSFEVWSRDARKLNELRELGYHVEVIWESDWYDNKNECMKRINDAYNRTL
jgi:G:T-mismatch repair DNA endonuclease (very short patch repair protein)/predicted transcriptional regulator